MLGQGTSTGGQGARLASVRGEGLGPQRGGAFQNLVKFATDAFLFLGEVLELTAVASLGSLVGTRGESVFLLCQQVQATAFLVESCQVVELAFQLLDLPGDGVQPHAGLLELSLAFHRIVGAAGGLNGRSGRLIFDFGDLACRPGQGMKRRVFLQIARQKSKLVRDLACGRFAVRQLFCLRLIPDSVAAPRDLGLVAELVGLLSVGGCRLLKSLQPSSNCLAISRLLPGAGATRSVR